uniref:Uncharacterized protein n=1 Tax=Candidatus Kentrum sp. TC TaxID=2126339 RepID=A0A450Z0T4_9GAMM|nr:MAG: hypothetical protein BECKTC1821D_GA0114238_104613 [Candidatus Kentron sp. TC]
MIIHMRRCGGKYIIPKKISSHNDDYYTLVRTHHGNLFLVFDKLISKRKYKKIYGNQNIIFHQNSHICPENNLDCAEGIDVSRGNVLELMDSQNRSDIKLRKVTKIGDFSRVKIGYLSKKKYEKYKKSGVITDASKRHPSYLHESTKEISSLGTECNQIKREINTNSVTREMGISVSPLNIISILKDLFSINAKGNIKDEKSGLVEMSYGLEHKAIEFYRTIVKVPDASGNFNDKRIFDTVATVKCIPEIGKKIYIQRVLIQENEKTLGMVSFSSVNGDITSSNIDADSREFNIYGKNGNRHFLTSINSTAHYERAIRFWISAMEDVGLANILMPIFNASCETKNRDICANILPALQ